MSSSGLSAIGPRWGEGESIQDMKDVVKTICLEEVNAISLARLSLLASPNCK